MKVINLAGDWNCTSPDGKINKTVHLPGSSCENGIGTPATYYDEYCKEAVRAPKERYEYIGELIYTRTVDIPADLAGMELSLFFERINISSKLFIDGIQVGRETIGLSTPHVYRLTDRVDSQGQALFTKNLTGSHEIKLVIDNSNILNMGDMASGYSIDTQGYWNGCIGRMVLQAKPVNNIDSIQVYPEHDHIRIATVTGCDRHSPMVTTPAMLEFDLITPAGKHIVASQDIELFSKKQRNWTEITLSPEDRIYWNEFRTGMYTLNVKLILCDENKVSDEHSVHFGLRIMSVKDKQFCINDSPLSLRGTINCAQYPLTGYPPMDTATWKKHFGTLKEYGLNHVRFHAWCPPEAAFEAADELGIYLAVEMPLWLNRDVTPMEFGDDDYHRIYYREEALRISETYGNHPSFVFFSNGNENLGDYALLETIIAETKAVDPRRLYTMSSNFDHPLSPYEDYLCAFEILHNKARIQFLHDEVAKSTTVNYDEMRKKVPVPFTSFEVGQYCITPDVDVCEKYTGAMMPVNFDIIRKEMKKHGVYSRLKEYIKASGMLAANLYKEDIEAVLRTKGMGGFQLLSISDYTGQSTATVGILDVFFESKGIISGKEWRSFCCEVVPLLWADRIYENTDTFSGFISIYDHGEKPIDNPIYKLKVSDEPRNRVICEKDIASCGNKTPFTVSLADVKENSMLTVSITVDGEARSYTNSWHIFVYRNSENAPHCLDITSTSQKFIKNRSDYENAAKAGGRYLILPEYYGAENTVKNSYIPVFWSPVHFPSEAPVGFMVDEMSEVLSNFPTGHYADYQWKMPVDSSVSLRLKDAPSNAQSVLEFVPNFADNEPKSPLFTFKDGGAEFLFCGFDLTQDDPASIALKESILSYISK